jgi:hypothetical protein
MSIAASAVVALLLTVDPPGAPPPSPPPAAESAVVVQPAAPAADRTPADLGAPTPAATPPASAAVSWAPPASVTASAPSASAGPKARQIRAGLGVSITDADSGFASTFQAGAQVDPWDRFGFRAGLGMTSSIVGAGGWDAAEFSGAVLYRPLGNERRVVPYAALGVQLAFLAIFPDSAPPPLQGLAKYTGGRLAPMMAGAEGGTFPSAREGFGGTNQFKVMPEATVGAMVRLSPRLDLDVAARYLPLFWSGTIYNGLSVVVSVCSPF